MTTPGAGWRLVRLSWPVLGGAWGAWTGFGGYLRLPHNADSFGSLLALGFFVAFALAGLVAGGAAGALVGGVVDAGLRRLGVGVAAAVLAATVVNALAMWLIIGFVQEQFPGLRSQVPARVGQTAPAAPVPGRTGSCQEPPPAPSKERAVWDSECR